MLHLIQSIPQERRFEVLQIKSLINVESTFRARVELDKTHILQWAACRHAPKDLRTILDALVNEQERYTLITQTIWSPDINHFYPQYFSPLMLATANIRMDNLIMMLNSLTHEHVIDAILPKKVSYFTPLYSHLHCLDTQRYIMPIFLEKLFGENQKLYGAYHYLKARNDWKTLKALRDHYLASHFPTPTQRHLGFFRFDFSIPGHPLSKEELDLVVRVRFYQRYYELDDIERGKIQAQMNAYDPPEGARVESRLTLSQF